MKIIKDKIENRTEIKRVETIEPMDTVQKHCNKYTYSSDVQGLDENQ